MLIKPQLDPRSKFAIYCVGEGWVPAFGKVNIFKNWDRAREYLEDWQKENPTSKYEIREVI